MQTLKNLLSELSEIQHLKDRRLAVLLLFLYAEHYGLKLCEGEKIDTKSKFTCANCQTISDPRSSTLPEIIEKLINAKLIREGLIDPFTLLHKIRNRMIHDITPDSEKISSWVKEFKPKGTTKYLNDAINKEDEWTKFYLLVVTAIASLYSSIPGTSEQLSHIERNLPTGLWIFHIK